MSVGDVASDAEIAATLQRCAGLINTWGRSRLANGRTLAETLTLEGFPLWELFAVDLARVYLPAAITVSLPSAALAAQLRCCLSQTKHRLHGIFRNRRSTRGCSTWPVGSTALCLGFSPYIFRDIVQPVAEKMFVETGLAAVSVGDSGWSEDVDVPALRYQTLWEHWTDEVAQEASALRRGLKRAERELSRQDGLAGIVREESRSWWPELEGLFLRFFRVQVPILIPHLVVARHILSDHRPAVIVSPDVADPRTRVFSVLGRQMGIPTVALQMGPIASAGVQIEWRYLVADCVVAWGEVSRAALRVYGVTPDRVEVTGSPRHDALVNLPLAEVPTARARLGVPDGTVFVVLASAYRFKTHDGHSDPSLLDSMKRAVFSAVERTPGLFLVVKPHPLEDAAETLALAGTCSRIRFVDRESDIRDLIRPCDAFVSFGTTATADALVAGKLTISVVFPGWIWNANFPRTGATLVVRSPEELTEAFDALASGEGDRIAGSLEPARLRFLHEWVGCPDGQAAARIARIAGRFAGKPGRLMRNG